MYDSCLTMARASGALKHWGVEGPLAVAITAYWRGGLLATKRRSSLPALADDEGPGTLAP